MFSAVVVFFDGAAFVDVSKKKRIVRYMPHVGSSPYGAEMRCKAR